MKATHSLFFFLFLLFLNLRGQQADTVLGQHYLDSAWAMVDSGFFDQAIEYGEKALELASNADEQKNIFKANAYDLIGYALDDKGELDQSLENYLKALEIKLSVRGEKNQSAADSYNNIGIIYDKKGEYDTALYFFDKALNIELEIFNEDVSRIDIARTYHNIGISYWNKGDYDRALAFLHKCLNIELDIFTEASPDLADTYLNIGMVYWSKGDYDRALEFEKKALGIKINEFGEKHLETAISYHNIGISSRDLGFYKEALDFHQRALNIWLQAFGETHANVASAYNEIGLTYRSTGDFDQALKFHEKALNIRLATLGEEHYDRAETYNNIGTIYWDKGNYDRALKFYRKASSIWRKIFGETHLDVAASYHNMGLINERKGDYVKSLEFHQNALAIYSEILGNNHPDVVSSLNRISYVYYLKKQYGLALDYSDKALHHLDLMRREYMSKETKQFHLSEKYAVFENAINTLKEAALEDSISFDLENAFLYSEKAKSNLLLEALHTTRAESFAGIPDSLLQQEYDLRVDLAYYDKKRFEEQQKGAAKNDSLLRAYNDRLFDLRRDYDALIARFEQDYPDYYRLKYDTEVLSVPEVQAMLEDDQALIEYFAGDSTIFVFTIKPDSFQVKKIARDFPLEDWVSDLRRGLYDYHYAHDQTDALYRTTLALLVDNAAAIYDKLLRPLGPLPEKLIIVPDGVLSYLPFEILLPERPKDEHRFHTHDYLFRRHQISYNFSATLWHWMTSRENRARNDLLAFAPAFRNLKPLKHNVPEAENIRRQIGGKVLRGAEASMRNFRQLAPTYRLLHFATHAKMDDAKVDYSFLAFSPDGDSLDDGKIYIRDLYELQLPADMVVLSACETSLGELKRGEGVVSLARGFAYAGAKSIVTSLWSANDQSTAWIMEDFYRNLRKGLPKDQALRQAKLNYLQAQSDPLRAHPFYWSAFVALGDMEAIEMGNDFPWLWIITVVLGLGLIWFLWRRYNR